MPRINVAELLGQIEIDQVAKKLGMQLREDTATRKMAICPFHNDKTPSLLIDTSRDGDLQHFHCFACGSHGTAIDLAKERLGTDFNGAVDWLESAFGISVGGKQAHPAVAMQSALDQAYEIYRSECQLENLGVWALGRRFDPAFLESVGFVYAKSGTLSRSERTKRMARGARIEIMGLLEDAGLVKKLLPTVGESLHIETGSEIQYLDAFIGDRVVFPVRDLSKKIVALAARAAGPLESLQKAKYLFSKGFAKAQTLYRADEAFARVRALSKGGATAINLYVCEGFLDALRLESLGQPAVAIMGAAISKDQVHILKDLNESLRENRTTVTIALCLDRDEAGLKGASAGALALLDAGLDVVFVWPSSKVLSSRGIPAGAKDPDAYLANTDAVSALELLGDSIHPAGLAVLAQQFGLSAEDVLDEASWVDSSESRKHRAYEKALAQLRKVRFFEPARARRWMGEDTGTLSVPAANWIDYLNKRSIDSTVNSNVFLTSSKAQINHARLLAYRGSRRGELACDEPRWERLDVAATAFNIVIAEQLRSNIERPTGPFDAVWVPRSFGGGEPRLKVMPRPEDLVIHQYLLNEFLSEKWDGLAIGTMQFSQLIPAVRHYREERKTITTGFSQKIATAERMVRDGVPLSFAYQIDMDVIEGRRPASDQGMFRPYQECWHEFMQSLKRQAADIGHVHAIRLDVSRYYDKVRRSVVRDALFGKVQAAFGTLPSDGSEFAELIGLASAESSAERAAQIVDRMADLIFGYPYRSPDDGRTLNSDPTRGIPQGPVISAWLGTITLFPVDQVAAEFMENHNVDGATRVGYARYVDDIVLLADSASLLEKLREAVDTKTRALDLTLLAKADSIPPMTSDEFSNYLNEGRMLDSSGPTWIPPIVGDGEPGWDFWSATPSSDRQSALQLLANLDLYRSSSKTIVDTVKTAFAATDLRATELAKGARLLWYAVGIDLLQYENDGERATATQIWEQFERHWSLCTVAAGWQLDPERNRWEAMHLFALEGLEKLIDHTGAQLRGLSLDEDTARQKRILALARVVTADEFRQYVFSTKSILQWQTQRRFGLLLWKASKATGIHLNDRQYEFSRSLPFHEWRAFEWFHAAVERLRAPTASDTTDPLAELVTPFAELASSGLHGESLRLFEYLLPTAGGESSGGPKGSVDVDLASAALQTIAALTPREKVFSVLATRPTLLDVKNSDHYLFMPPLPGVKQQHLIACELTEAPAASHLVNSFTAFGFVRDEASMPELLGSAKGVTVKLAENWDEQKIRDLVVRRTASLPVGTTLSVRFIPHRAATTTPNSLRFAADLYRKIVRVIVEYRKQFPGFELVPAWPYIAQGNGDEVTYLLTEGVREDELGNLAFVRDGGRALRTIEVPIFEAHLWRAGMALTDFLGFHDDITKFKSTDVDLPLDDEPSNGLATYVLRAQCRKLRGTFADSTITKKRGVSAELPATIERALQILEQFPIDGNVQLQLKYVLSTEVETAAMRFRLQNQRITPDAHEFLSAVVGTVLARIPLAIASSLASSDDDIDGLRRDLAGMLALARTLWRFPSDEPQDERLVSWHALRSGVVLLGVRFAIEGLSTSLRSHPDFAFNESFDFPAEWEIPPTPMTVESGGETTGDAHGREQRRHQSDPLEALRSLIRLLGHRIRSTGHPHDLLSSKCVSQIKALAKSLAALEVSGRDTDEFAWPFSCVNDFFLSGLRIELLESAAELIRKLDAELDLNVALVRHQSYGFNAQTRRFTDSSNRTWDFKPSMISQFPLRAKTIEEEHCDGLVQRIWTEVHDRKTGRLLSVAVLGEPFASIAISRRSGRPNVAATSGEKPTQPSTQPVDIAASSGSTDEVPSSARTSDKDGNDEVLLGGYNAPDAEARDKAPLTSLPAAETGAHAFRRKQQDEWSRRNGARNPAHVRVAVMQWNIDLSYPHPISECSPTSWPLGRQSKKEAIAKLKASGAVQYKALFAATEGPDKGFLWNINGWTLKSWAEHRRRRFLERAINACEDFGVDLLVLPEYSVRAETVEWLKVFLAGKQVAVLAGTYMEFSENAPNSRSSAVLSLLWPIPENVLFDSTAKHFGTRAQEPHTGRVLQLQRSKKYRSVGLNEFIRPSSAPMGPLFVPTDLVKAIADQHAIDLSPSAIVNLLGSSRLPLRHFIELICSEIFLLTSPANYPQIADDYVWIRRRFGEPAGKEEVFKDVQSLAGHLAIVATGNNTRRTITVVPAATTRTADYWIAGQAALLAAGTTTVFCNATGSGLKGGSCFIGRESWKRTDGHLGFISSITPYHGWSKGIYYNSKDDPLSESDQAMVIADIDPVHMLEGKPRPQLLPVPLQLVAYLPIAETVDLATLNQSICRKMTVEVGDPDVHIDHDGLPSALHCHNSFWEAVKACAPDLNDEALRRFSTFFSDSKAVSDRLRAAFNDGKQQPCSSDGGNTVFSSPAFYDWLDVDLSLKEGDDIPEISVPAWP